jgi:hypothetical protein
VDPAGRVIEVGTGAIDHTPEAIDVWAAELRMRFGGQSIAVALEQSRGSLVFMLTKYEHLGIFLVHPTVLVNYRKSFRPSGAKADPSDARLLLDILTLPATSSGDSTQTRRKRAPCSFWSKNGGSSYTIRPAIRTGLPRI